MEEPGPQEPSLHSEVNQLRTDVADLKKLLKTLASAPQRTGTRTHGHTPTVPDSQSHLCWYHYRFGDAAKKCKSPCTKVGKLSSQSLMATSEPGLFSLHSRLFYITDKLTGHRFLIDTGAEVSVIPPSQSDQEHKQDLVLQAANNTSITTYGRRSLTLNLGLGLEFQWIIIVADIKRPILGIDFLRHYALIVDVRQQQLLDTPHSLK